MSALNSKICSVLSVLFLASALGAFSLRNHDSGYAVWIHADTPPCIRYAAEELSELLAQSLGRKFPIHHSLKVPVNALHLGRNDAVPSIPEPPDDIDAYTRSVSDAGVSFFSVKGSERGILYGVYDMLENDLGYRWYAPEVQFIPQLNGFTLKNGVTTYAPPIVWREVFYYEASEPIFAGRRKLNGNTSTQIFRTPKRRVMSETSHGDWGLWCHSMFSLLDPKLYEKHPEYFAFVNGRRTPPKPDGTQACMSNPEVARIVIDTLRKKMATQPVPAGIPWADQRFRYWSVSQMDGLGNCTCSECIRLDKHAQSHIGSILYLVNQVAKAFPDEYIGTLSYVYSRKAPVNVILEPNVAIQLCSIEAPRIAANEPVGTSSKHQSFREDLVNWGKLSKQIIIWDYVIQFQNLLAPFPNWDVLQNNIQFFNQNKVRGIFCQGNREVGGEFAQLRTYLLSKLLWNPQSDIRKDMAEFLQGYYGAAAPYLQAYIDLQVAELKKSGLSLSIDGEPEAHRKGFLSQLNVAKYNELFDKAEAAVREFPDKLARVQKERMGIEYVTLRLKYGSVEERRQLLERFNKKMEINEIWMLSEVDTREDQMGNREMFFTRMQKELK